MSAKWGKTNMVNILLENGAVINAKTKDGLTPLHCAARSGHEEVVSTLLENSAPISARSKVIKNLCQVLENTILFYIELKHRNLKSTRTDLVL